MSSVDSPSSSESSFEPSITEKLGKHVWFRITNLILDDDYNPLIPEREEEKPLSIAELKMRYMRNYLLSKKDKYCADKNIS